MKELMGLLNYILLSCLKKKPMDVAKYILVFILFGSNLAYYRWSN